MAGVYYSDRARYALEVLPAAAAEGLSQRIEYLKEMPRMYALREDERFPGCRSFWLDPCYRVFYMVAAGGDDVYVVAVVEEDVDTQIEI